MSKELELFVTVMLLEDTPAVLSLGKLCYDHGFYYHWTSGQKPQHIKHFKKFHCDTSNHVPFVVPGLSTSSATSSSSTSPTSSSQETVSDMEIPATRSGSMSEEPRGNPSRGSAETENPHRQMMTTRNCRMMSCKVCQIGLDENVQPHQYSPSSCEQKWYRVRVSIASFFTSRKTESVTSA